MIIPQRNSLVNLAAESPRAAIRHNEFARHLPNVRVLSRDLHVSIPTVLGAIRVLEEEGMVRSQPGKRTLILVKKSKSGGWKKRKHREVAILTYGYGRTWFMGSDHYQSVLGGLRELEIRIRLFEFTHMIQGMHEKTLEDITSTEKPNCWVLLGPPAEVQAFFAKKQLPCIIDGGTVPGLPIPDFEVDYPALYWHAAGYLQRNGHRRICLITTEHSYKITRNAVKIFDDAVRSKLSPQTSWQPIRTYDGSIGNLHLLLRSLFADKKRAPTALVIAHVKRVAATMMWLMKHGFRIPQDVSIISRDCDDLLENIYPLPAHYRQPPSAANRFVRAILAVIDKMHIRPSNRIITKFVEGETSAAISTARSPGKL